MTSASVPSNPFVAGAMIEDAQLFVGRQDELRDMASTNINLYFCCDTCVSPSVIETPRRV
jgi:hypothetical protein